jgi:antitoxin (DNA-binding transcriptional repressor) of toxin-antitoxin stability system
MRTISVGEMKVNWSLIEEQIRAGETFEVVDRGRPTAHIVAAAPRRVLKWDDHLSTSIPAQGRSSEETVAADREGRF